MPDHAKNKPITKYRSTECINMIILLAFFTHGV